MERECLFNVALLFNVAPLDSTLNALLCIAQCSAQDVLPGIVSYMKLGTLIRGKEFKANAIIVALL